MAQHTRSTLDLGLLALRIGVGGTLFAHGAQKLFGWFGGEGLNRTGQMFDDMGFKPGRPAAVAAGLSEVGGAMIVAGAMTPLAAAGAVGAMIGASSLHRSAGFFSTSGGYEFPAVLGVASAALALTGPGRYSVDAAAAHRVNTNSVATAALAAATVGAVAVVMRRERALSTKPSEHQS